MPLSAGRGALESAPGRASCVASWRSPGPCDSSVVGFVVLRSRLASVPVPRPGTAPMRLPVPGSRWRVGGLAGFGAGGADGYSRPPAFRSFLCSSFLFLPLPSSSSGSRLLFRPVSSRCCSLGLAGIVPMHTCDVVPVWACDIVLVRLLDICRRCAGAAPVDARAGSLLFAALRGVGPVASSRLLGWFRSARPPPLRPWWTMIVAAAPSGLWHRPA